MKVKLSLFFLLVSLVPVSLFGAENAAPLNNDPEQNEEDTIESGLLPGAVSILPGVIVHGAGHYIGGDRETAADLLIMEAAGLLAFAGAGYAIIYTGASTKILVPALPVITAGAGLFILSWFYDIYGSFSGARRAGRQRQKIFIETDGGLTYVYDPQFEYNTFATLSAVFKYNEWRISPEAWIAIDDDNRRYVIDVSYQLIGDSGYLFKKKGEYLDLRFTNRYGYHKFGTEKFLKRWIDFCFTGRLEMGGVWESLNGSFTEFEAGYNSEWVSFLIDRDVPAEYTDQYLFSAGFGVYLGSREKPPGEIMIYYNHRREELAGGMKSGYIGYIGLNAEFKIISRIRAALDIRYGSALIIGGRLAYMI